MRGVLQTGAYFPGIGAFAGSTVLLASVLAVLVLHQREYLGPGEMAVLLELLAPMSVLMAAAGLVQSDPALETISAARYPVSRLMLNRWVVLILIGTIPAVVLHLIGVWVIPGTVLPVLTSLSPLLFLSSLALFTAALSATTTAGIGAATAWWAASLLTAGPLRDACASASPGICVVSYLSTSHTIIGMGTPGWGINRFALLIAAALMLWWAALLYQRTERQLQGRTRAGAES